jgi:hypothetical protein
VRMEAWRQRLLGEENFFSATKNKKLAMNPEFP